MTVGSLMGQPLRTHITCQLQVRWCMAESSQLLLGTVANTTPQGCQQEELHAAAQSRTLTPDASKSEILHLCRLPVQMGQAAKVKLLLSMTMGTTSFPYTTACLLIQSS